MIAFADEFGTSNFAAQPEYDTSASEPCTEDPVEDEPPPEFHYQPSHYVASEWLLHQRARSPP